MPLGPHTPWSGAYRPGGPERRRDRVRLRSARSGALPGTRDPAAAREQIDHVMTCCCDGPTIDLACGSGRLADRLMRQGIAVLSVDLSSKSVAATRSRGVPALHRDLFDRLPATGRWAYALLADGVVGFGGDPARVLRRTRDLLAPDGIAVVEFAPAGTDSIGIEHVGDLAAVADLRVITTVVVAEHGIAWLTR
ncbi:class I SAM-dependent methyltransferase [Nocardia heshunensis]